MVGCAFAAGPVELPLSIGTLKLRDGSVYEDAKVVGQDAVGLKIMHAGGTARLPFAKLPKELADRFPRDAKAAKEQLEKEAKEATAHERSVDKAVAKQKTDEEEAEEDDGSQLSWEKAPEAEGNARAKIAALEAYIRRLEDGVDNAREDAARSRERANESRATSVTPVSRVTSTGEIYTESRTNRSKIRRAEFLERKARGLDLKIIEAGRLIESTRQRIRDLEKTL